MSKPDTAPAPTAIELLSRANECLRHTDYRDTIVPEIDAFLSTTPTADASKSGKEWKIKKGNPLLAATWEIWQGDKLIVEGLVITDAKALRDAHNATLPSKTSSHGEQSDDTERLDWLERRLSDESLGWHDIIFAHDFEDGFWLELIERGSWHGKGALDDFDTCKTLRKAINAAMSREGKDAK